jgi:hypothetical protein
MFQLSTYLVGIVFILVNTVHAQVDPSLCADTSSSPQDPKWRTIPSRFEIISELITGNDVIELSQAFSPTRDSLAFDSAAVSFRVYNNYLTNETFEIINSRVNNQSVSPCIRQVIGPDSQTSVIVPRTFMLKPSTLLGFGERNQPNPSWKVRYDSDGDKRGVPTQIFKSCFFVNDIKATVSATYHVSDVDKFQAYIRANQSIILEIEVTVKPQVGIQESYRYNVFHYTPNPSRREERQALETPTGVYCPNRTSTLRVPSNIPDRVSSSSEVLAPGRDMPAIVSTHALYDTEFQYTRFDAWFPDPDDRRSAIHFTEIHDFAVGLRYRYDNARHQCTVRNITRRENDAVVNEEDTNLLQMGSPEHLFLLDDMDYQYTGEKPCRDRVFCHVWIGEKVEPNNVVEHREWYWSSTINGDPVVRSIPMKLVVKRYQNGRLNNSFETNLFDFRRNPRTIFEIDFTLAECYRALGPAENYNLAVLSFRIGNDKQYPVFENLNYLRLHIWETLIFSMFVRPTRISHLTVDQDDESTKDIIVTFTLLDAPPRTGPVEDPLREASIDRVVQRLSQIIDSNGLRFRGRYGSRQVNLFAREGSLNVPHRSSQTKEISSGPTITGLWIGLILIGLVIGGVGGFFAFGKLATK